jgi:hypothetical protein
MKLGLTTSEQRDLGNGPAAFIKDFELSGAVWRTSSEWAGVP